MHYLILNPNLYYMKSILHKLETIIFPYICNICKSSSDINFDLCSSCLNKLPVLVDRCYVCGAYLDKLTESVSCESCQDITRNYDRLCPLFEYTDPISSFITRIKYNRDLKYAKLFGRLFAKRISKFYKSYTELPEVIIPVPLATRKHKIRGFNQSYSIFKYAARELEIKLDLNIVKKVKNTKAQAKLNKNDRKRNLKSAFQVAGDIPYQHIAIVDDVYTTGSTVDAVSYGFRERGVELIDVWVIARA